LKFEFYLKKIKKKKFKISLSLKKKTIHLYTMSRILQVAAADVEISCRKKIFLFALGGAFSKAYRVLS